MTDYRLLLVRVFVTDWDRAVRFYTEMLEMRPRYDSGVGWMQLDAGPADLAIELVDPDDPEAEELVGRFVGASLEVGDIHTVHRELVAKGVAFHTSPTAQPWGAVTAHFEDPDGNVLTLLGKDPSDG